MPPHSVSAAIAWSMMTSVSAWLPRDYQYPQVLSLRPDGRISQKPLLELAQLRRAHIGNSDFVRNNSSQRFDQVQSDLLEIKVEFNPEAASEFRLTVRCSKDPSRFVRIACDGEHLEVKGDKTPEKLMQGEKTLRLQVFLGRDYMEILSNAWIVYTESMSVPLADLGIESFSE
jgi:sucrose-6-phosphate hydrolase SacC (GH32 family)